MPIAIDRLNWKLYLINGAWDIVIVVLVAIFWVETKGKTLEEIDAVFEGEKHTDVPDLENIYAGKAGLAEDAKEVVRAKSMSG